MGEEFLRIGVSAEPGADAEELDRLITDLREELLELDVQAVERVPGGPAPGGAKGPAAADIACLAVLTANSAAVAALAGLLSSWAGRNRRRKVTVRLGQHEITVDEASGEDAAALIKSWIELHGQRRV